MFRILPFVMASLLVTSCSNLQGASGDESYPKSREQREAERIGKITGEDGISFGKGKKKSAATDGINVNSYLWRATLDTVHFMPVLSADPFGGTVLTDWYKSNSNKNERYKLNVYIIGTELRSDAVKVSVFKQKHQDGSWIDIDTDRTMAAEIEDKILLRARELKHTSVN